MRDIGLVIKTSIKNNLRLKIVVIVFISVVLICVAGLVLALCLLLIGPEMKAEMPDRHKLEIYLALVLYATCLIGVGVYLNSFAFQSMVREKSRGNIESLLATPLKVKDIWIAKSLAVFLPGLIVGEFFTLIALIVINCVYFVPKIGFLITPWIALSSFVAAPLVYLCFSLLVYLVGLTGKPASGNIIAQIFLPVFVNLMLNLMAHNILDATSWTFTLTNLGVAAIIGVIAALLQPRLNRERIVLSR